MAYTSFVPFRFTITTFPKVPLLIVYPGHVVERLAYAHNIKVLERGLVAAVLDEQRLVL